MFDLRLPIGLFFVINAAILAATGLMKPSQSHLGSYTFDLNLTWSLVMGAFGLLMLLFVWMAKGKADKPKP